MNKYFSLVKVGQEADINIYGDITSWPWEELGEVSAYNLSKQLEEMKDVSKINVHISSYGGEVKEGLAIYNALKQHPAKVATYCDSFACSIASVIFMAGDERYMSKASLLMIHNAWTYVEGNADELRKQADDLDTITRASVEAYKTVATIDEKQIKKLMNAETWITPEKAIEYGFATGVVEEKTDNVNQSVKKRVYSLLVKQNEEAPATDDAEDVDGAEAPQDEAEPEGEEITPGEEENPADESLTGEKANQMLIGFFNAIKN